MDEVCLNAENCIAGRAASRAAKELLKGRKVIIVNAEKAVITGNKQYTVRIWLERVERGDPYHGPFAARTPDRILRRMVRGMLPYKKPLGKKAFSQLRVYLAVPEELKGRELQAFSPPKPQQKHITLGELSRRMT